MLLSVSKLVVDQNFQYCKSITYNTASIKSERNKSKLSNTLKILDMSMSRMMECMTLKYWKPNVMRLKSVLVELHADDMSILLMKYQDDMSIKEICDVMGKQKVP